MLEKEKGKNISIVWNMRKIGRGTIASVTAFVDDEAHTALTQAHYNWIKWNVLFDWNLFVRMIDLSPDHICFFSSLCVMIKFLSFQKLKTTTKWERLPVWLTGPQVFIFAKTKIFSCWSVLVVIKDLDIWNMSNGTISIFFFFFFDFWHLLLKN